MLTSQILDAYCREHVALKCVDQRRVGVAIAHINRVFGEKDVSSIDIPACRGYALERQNEGVSLSTIRRELTVLQAAANHAVRWRKITPAEQPSIELPPESEPRLSWLFEDEVSALISNAQGRGRAFIILAYATAARKETVESLRWSQVCLKTRRIDLNSNGRTRTKKRRPIVPLREEIVQFLHIQKQTTGDSEFVLGSSACVRYEFDKAAKAANLTVLPARGLRPESRCTPHLLRHSRATHLLQAGKPPFAVANLLGDTLQTLLRVYGHACPDYMQNVLD